MNKNHNLKKEFQLFLIIIIKVLVFSYKSSNLEVSLSRHKMIYGWGIFQIKHYDFGTYYTHFYVVNNIMLHKNVENDEIR